MKQRRQYAKEFKIAAVRQIEETGRDVRDIAFDLGIHHNTLYRWWLELRESGEEAIAGQGQSRDSDDEVRRLKRELARVREERDILKKAVTFFAKESK
jgi:transposase